MRTFASNEQCVRAVVDLAARLEAGGHEAPAREIRQGMARINGLTDGWAHVLDAIEAVERGYGERLEAGEREELSAIRQAAYKAVYRR